MTAFVLFSRTAGTWIVTADLVGFTFDRLRFTGDSFTAVAHGDALRTLLMLLDVLNVLLASQLNRENLLDNILLHYPHHCFEHFEAFFLIFNQRVALSITTKADPLLKMVHRQEMVFPQGIEGLQHHDFFNLPHYWRSEFSLSLVVDGAHLRNCPVHQLFGGVDLRTVALAEAWTKLELAEVRFFNFLPVPIGRILFGIGVGSHDAINQFGTHVEDVFLEACAAQ